MQRKKILFVCNCNRNRSPMFERYFKKNLPQYNVRSAGIAIDTKIELTDKLIKWADEIYAMDMRQYMYIYANFRYALSKTKLIGINEEYKPYLKEQIEFWAKNIFNKSLVQ